MLRKFVVKDINGNVIRTAETSYLGSLDVFAGPDAADGATVEEVGVLPDPPAEELPAITRDDVNSFARRLLSDTDWYVMRAQDPGGAEVPQEVWDYRAAVRVRAGEIGNMIPIPEDYRNAQHWPDRL